MIIKFFYILVFIIFSILLFALIIYFRYFLHLGINAKYDNIDYLLESDVEECINFECKYLINEEKALCTKKCCTVDPLDCYICQVQHLSCLSCKKRLECEL